MLIPFRDLPAEVRERLAAATASHPPPPDHFVVPTEGRAGKWAAMFLGALAAGGAGAVAVAIDGYRWGQDETLGVAFLAILGALLFVPCFLRARLLARSRVKPAVVVTPLVLARTGLAHERVELRALRDVISWRAEIHSDRTRYQYRRYLCTSFHLAFGPEDVVSFDVHADAGELRRALGAWLEPGAAPPASPSLDWIGAVKSARASGPEPPAAPPDLLLRSRLARVALAVAIGAVLAAPVITLKERARTEHRARLDAEDGRRERYDAAEQAWLAGAKDADPLAVKGIRAALVHLRERSALDRRERSAPVLAIEFAPPEGLDEGPAGRRRAREDRFVESLRGAFGRLFPEDLLEVRRERPGCLPRLVVRDRADGSGAVEVDAELYVWPDTEPRYRLAERRAPAPGTTPAPGLDRLLDLAFDELAAALAPALGLPPEPEGGSRRAPSGR